jgi:hypothetical protein
MAAAPARRRSFLEKRTKKLLSIWRCAKGSRAAPNRQSLFASFSSEKEGLA